MKKHHRAKLTDEQVAEMRRLRAADATKWGYAALGREFCCSESTARDIVLYRTRTDVIVEGIQTGTASKDKFDFAFEVRQKILDFVNELGVSTNSQIVNHFGLRADHVCRTCVKMANLGELKRHGTGTNTSWTPLMTQSTPASQLRNSAYNKRDKARTEYYANYKAESKPIKHKYDEPLRNPVYRHCPGNPIPNQEAIGTGRSRVYANSTCGMV